MGDFFFADNGYSWQDKNSSLYAHNVSCLISYDSIIFAGKNYGGVYISSDDGDSWTFQHRINKFICVFNRQMW